MEKKKQQRFTVGIVVLAIVTIGVFFTHDRSAIAADREGGQRLVDRARDTFDGLLRDPNYTWFHDNLSHAKAVLIFPQVIKGGFVFGASGGTGVLSVKDEKTGNWSEPAFYTFGSVTFGPQIGGEVAEVILLAMTQKAIDSLLSSSFKLGGDVSVTIGPIGAGAKAQADIPNVTADFLASTKSKGLYAGLTLEGSVVAVRDSLNKAYYGESVRPVDILVSHSVRNKGADELRATLACGQQESCG